ncbi:MAG: hypothetical protein M3116_05930 [Actinomycetota bacterium]|nr:hypothetical protein [Actinomycetota bacterium]
MPIPRSVARQRLLTLALGVWALVWLAAGCITAVQIRNLDQLSDSLAQSGQALDTAGSGLQAIGRVPVLGERPKQLGDEVRVAAEEVRLAGMSSRETIRWVSLLVGAALVIIPIAPAAAWYAPLRSVARQRRSLGAALEHIDQHPRLEEFLARRAVQHLEYDELRSVSQDPWGDLDRGAYRRLANAELTRLGLAGTGPASGQEPPGKSADRRS